MDDSIQSISIKRYKLNNDGIWDDIGGVADTHKDKKGKIAISITNGFNTRISMTGENEQYSYISNTDIDDIAKTTATAIDWNNGQKIIADTEIPLMIFIKTNQNSVKVFDADSFFNTDRLIYHDIVVAITVEFSTVRSK